MVLTVPIDKDSPKCHKFDKFWKKVLYIAELRCTESAGLSSNLQVPKSEILPQIRSRGNLHKPYIKGKFVSIQNVYDDETLVHKNISIEFNSDKNAWHYAWHSHKHIADATHVVDISVLVDSKHNADLYFVAGSYTSPEFTLACTKRRKNICPKKLENDLPKDENVKDSGKNKRAKLDICETQALTKAGPIFEGATNIH